jgi:hypothetical protein
VLGGTLTVYAVTRDTAGNFVGNVAADFWELVDETGGVVDADLVPSFSMRNATLTGNSLGSAKIQAQEGVLPMVTSGTITVIAPPP